MTVIALIGISAASIVGGCLGSYLHKRKLKN